MMKYFLILTSLFVLSMNTVTARGTYQTPVDFLNETFANKPPVVKKIWITGKVREVSAKILQHKPQQLRLSYWQQDSRSVWILNEIGKERAITAGIIVKDGMIETIKVLIFRESRGDEIRHDFFTKQFHHIALTKEQQLDRSIDGISGATLSVRALTKLSRLALYLSQQIKQ